jgi:uncharacterized cupin superfamily protein
MFRSIRETPPIQVQSKSTGELFTVARLLTDGSGVSGFSVIHEELPPGRRTSSPHNHTKKDEMYIVLSGSPAAYIDRQKRVLHSGDYIIFRSEAKQVHYLANETSEDVVLLQISSCPPDDVVEYEK